MINLHLVFANQALWAEPKAWFTICRIALQRDAMRHRAALATIYEHEIASATRRIASCRAASRG